jgi:hypothetical protein
MAIQIVRNQSGNCIEFRGSSNPVYWNACIHGEVDAGDSTLVNVVNDVATAASAETVYEFYQIPFVEFRDQDNNAFGDAAAAAAYITAVGNVTDAQNASYLGVWDADTNTPDISATSPSSGDFYYVSVAGSTTLDGVSVWDTNDRVIYNGTAWEKIQAVQLFTARTRSVALSTNTAIPADGDSGIADPTNQTAGWYYRNDANQKINWYFYGDTPVIDNELGDFDGFYAVVDFRSDTSYLFWTVYTKFQGDGQDQSWYRSRVTYNDENLVQGNTGTYLVHSAGMDVSAIHPTLPRLSVGVDALTTIGLQAADEEIFLMSLSTSSNYPEGYNEFVVSEVGYKLGEVIYETALAATPTTGPSVDDTTPESLDFRIDPTNTTILLDDGTQYGVNSIQAQGNGDGTVDIVALPDGQHIYQNLAFGNLTIQDGPAYSTEAGAVNALNSLFQVQPLGSGGDYTPTYPLLDLADVTTTQTNGNVPTTTLSDGVTPHLMVSSANNTQDAIWSTETIDTAGEFYTVRICGKGRFILGLGSEADGDRAELAGAPTSHGAGLVWGNAFYNYGSYRAPWTYYGSSAAGTTGPGWSGPTEGMMRYNTSVQDELDVPNLKDGALFKVGIDQQGFMSVWYYDEGRSNDWILTARRSLTTAAGDYFLVVKLWDGTATLAQLPQRSAVDPVAPVLDYRYIESPDGSFDYPLFATAEEAEYVDINDASQVVVYPDDPTFTQWYAPVTDFTQDDSAAPVDGFGIIWDEIPTLADEQFAPASFDISDLTVDEGAAVNYQVAPADATGYSTTVTGLPSGLAFDGATVVQGNAPIVADDNVTNPSDDFTITVTRANDYGSTVDTFVLTVNNLTAPQVEISGFQHVTGSTPLVDSDTMDDGSVVYMEAHLDHGERMILPQAWMESYVLPAMAAGGTVYIGVPDNGADWTNIEQADFDAFIKIYPYSNSGYHYSQIASPTSSSLVLVSGTTDAYYDYAFEHDGTDLHMIACNVNAINTEPAVNEGGSFSRVRTWSNATHNHGQSYRIYIAVTGAQMDLSATGINVLDIPSPAAPANQTAWTKALDFSGAAERAEQGTTSNSYNPLMMTGISTTVAAPGTAGNTSSDSNARPWATTVVFKSDGNASTQHIWNLGEGAGSGDDNIYLKVDAQGQLQLVWGRSGALNQCRVASGIQTNTWYGVYIAHNGTRLSGANATANATAANLADCFDIRFMRNNGGTWEIITGGYGDGTGNRSTSNNWNAGSTGGRMDRTVAGATTIGGRGSNRNFHGKVASMVVTTLRLGVAMPTDAEIETMVTDPTGWVNDYKIGNPFRAAYSSSDSSNFQLGYNVESSGTQVWLMGDGTSDAYSKIRNQIYVTEQGFTPLNMLSMVSNDIETVNIPGLS